MHLRIEFLSLDRSLFGFIYNRGKATLNENNQKVIFHEIGVGIILCSVFITFFDKSKSVEN